MDKIEEEFAKGFKEIREKYGEILKEKDRFLYEVLDRFVAAQKKYNEMLEAEKNEKRRLYLTGLTDGIDMIVGLYETVIGG